jgi:hypothetical protein
MPLVDDAGRQAIGEAIAGEFDLLLGRRTYEIFAGYWPSQGDHPIAKAFNKATKYVVTRRLDRLDYEELAAHRGQCCGGGPPAEGIRGAGVARLGERRIGADADRSRACRRTSPLGLSVGARRRKAALRTGPSAIWALAGCYAEHAKRRPPQHLSAGWSPSEGVKRSEWIRPAGRGAAAEPREGGGGVEGGRTQLGRSWAACLARFFVVKGLLAPCPPLRWGTVAG